MTIVVKDRNKAIMYHEALIDYSATFLRGLRDGIAMDRLNMHTLPINIIAPEFIRQYTRGLTQEIEKSNSTKEMQHG